jgi:tetratricopeptide (TPR) repeat protein
MSKGVDELLDLLLKDPDARQRLAQALAIDMEREARRSWWHRARPFLAGASSALVVLLAFLIPSVQEQWNDYKTREAVDRYAQIGRNLLRDGHYDSAEQSFTRALELAGSQRLDLLEAQIKARVMRVYEDPAWRGSIPEDLRESDFVYLLEIEDAAHHPRDRASTLTAYGAFLAGHNRPMEAERYLREATRLDASAADPHIHLGNLYDDTGRTEEAEAEYRRAIALDAREANAHYDLGLLLAATQRPALAEAEFRSYMALRPSDPAGQLQLAQALMAQNRRDAALAAAQAAVKLDPHNEEAQMLVKSLRGLPGRR